MSGVHAAKPAAIGRACGLLWASLLVGVLKTAMDWTHLRSQSRDAFNVLVTIVFVFALTGFFIWKIGQGKNWARIVFLVLWLIGAVPFVVIVRSDFARSPASASVSVIQVVLQVAALFLIFTNPGKEWFVSTRAQAIPPTQ
jgi:hypothetical protein